MIAIRKKQTLFDYVYQNLREQIITGRLQYGVKLPSMTCLCDFYHVGIRTVKDVLRTLKEEGYIKTEERKAAVVIYRQQKTDEAIRSVLTKKKVILEVYQTLTALMPWIFAFSAQFCDKAKLKLILENIEQLRDKEKKMPGVSFLNPLYELLDRSNNLLFRDLFANLEIYARMPFFQRYSRYLELITVHNQFRDVSWVLESLMLENQEEVVSRFRLMFQTVEDAIRDHLEEMSREFGEIEETEEAFFQWKAETGRDHYYMQITRDLIDKISVGIYKEGSFLPSEAELASQYQVCISTIRNALSVLNELGFGKTLNAKGTMVLLQTDADAFRCMKNKTYKKDTLMYLSGLQLMAIAIRPAARQAFDHISIETAKDLREKVRESHGIPLGCIVTCVIDHQSLSPLKTILEETAKFLNWGYYFSFFSKGPESEALLAELSEKAVDYLIKGEADSFADILSHSYCHILDLVRDFLAECGLPEAGKILTPQIQFYKI